MIETLWQTQRRSAACGVLSGLLLVVAVVLSRRISGDAAAFSSELAACLTGVTASLVAIFASLTPGLVSDRLTQPQRTLLVSGCGIPGVMLGLAVMPPGSSTGLTCLLGIHVTVVLAVTALSLDEVLDVAAGSIGSNERQADSIAASTIVAPDTEHSTEISRVDVSPQNSTLGTTQPPAESTLEERLVMQAVNASSATDQAQSDASEESALLFEPSNSMPHPASNPETTQWMSRSTVGGVDVAEGAFQVRFAAGQRLVPVHLPFSPPLAGIPEFECEPADDSELRFRTTAVHAYGIRIEVSRSTDCDQEATIDVAWMASAALSESAAA